MRPPNSAIAEVSGDSPDSPEIDPDRENGEPFKVPVLEPSGGAAIPPLCPFAKGFAEMVPSMRGKDDT
jgi:hypothetical protein